MHLSNAIYAICGHLEKFQATGALVSPTEMQFLVASLSACAEQARADAMHAKWMSEQLDAEVERSVRAKHGAVFSVIEGGRP